MTILADREIEDLCTRSNDEGKYFITPYVGKMSEEGVISYGQSSFGYDMRAGYEWHIFDPVDKTEIIDPKKPTNKHYRTIKLSEQSEDNSIIIPANSYALTHSLETLCMPRNVFGICVGKSTLARAGIIVNVTPLEPGWEGQITIEVSNSTPLPVKVYAGEGIMQVCFFLGSEPERTYGDRAGKYQGQIGITHGFVKEKKA